MPKLIAVCGATGTQGGAVANELLRYSKEYTVRALSRAPESPAAQQLERDGAVVYNVDFDSPSELDAAFESCWGVFAMTTSLEWTQGKNLVDAAEKAQVKCFVWSTLPASKTTSGGRRTAIFDAKHAVDQYIRQKPEFPATFLYLGYFYENLIKQISYDPAERQIVYEQPIVRETTQLPMVYVKKDLPVIVKAIFDQWGTHKNTLWHSYMVKKKCGNIPGIYRTGPPSPGKDDRNVMAELCNEFILYEECRTFPDPNVEKLLGIKLQDNLDDFIQEVLKKKILSQSQAGALPCAIL
ncbi:hypothetical protein C8Q76DRAFT_696267 [Earliella scabrosa]|nr:hypothetical protein C8Q76DRAFT_696267 [Earliella scabrosa]